MKVVIHRSLAVSNNREGLEYIKNGKVDSGAKRFLRSHVWVNMNHRPPFYLMRDRYVLVRLWKHPDALDTLKNRGACFSVEYCDPEMKDKTSC